MVDEYNKLHNNNEEQKQFLLLVVEEYCQHYPDQSKNMLAINFIQTDLQYISSFERNCINIINRAMRNVDCLNSNDTIIVNLWFINVFSLNVYVK